MKTSRDVLLFRGYEECFREKYPSRKNEVAMCCAMNQDCYSIEYVFKTVEDPSFEVSMLKHLYASGVNVPELMALDPQTIMMEYIRGISMSELLKKYEASSEDISKPMAAMRKWLESYHAAVESYEGKNVSSKGDLSLSNFVYTPDEVVFGFDFEDGDYEGSFIDDLHMFAANILVSEPMFTDYKKDAAKALLGEEFDKSKLVTSLEKIKAEMGLDFDSDINM